MKLGVPKTAHLRQQSVFRINRLQKIVKELVSTEEQYVRVLSQFYYDVITPIQEKKILKPHVVRNCFPSMANNLYTLHKCLLEDLRPIAESYEGKKSSQADAGVEWFQKDRELFNIMQQWLPGFGLYKNYIIEHHECLDRLKEEMKRTKKLRKFIDKACSKFSKSIESFFIAPIQRLPRYILLFDEITKFQKGELVTLFDKTKTEIEQLTHDMNETKKWFDQTKEGQQLLERQPILRKVAVRLENGMLDARVVFQTRVMLHDRAEPRAKKFRLHVLEMQIVLEPLQNTSFFQNALPKVLYFDQWFSYESAGYNCAFPNAVLLFSSSYSGLVSFEMRRDMQACQDALKEISQYHTRQRKTVLTSHTNRKIWVRCLVCENEFDDAGGSLEKTKCQCCGRWLCTNCCNQSVDKKIVCASCKTLLTKAEHIVQKVADPDTNKTKHIRKATPHSIKRKAWSPSIPLMTPTTPTSIADDQISQSGVTIIEYPSMAFKIEVSEQEDWSSPRYDYHDHGHHFSMTPDHKDPTNLLGNDLNSDVEEDMYMSEEDDSIDLGSPPSLVNFKIDPAMKPTRTGAFLASLKVEDFSTGMHKRSLTMGSQPFKKTPKSAPSFSSFKPFKDFMKQSDDDVFEYGRLDNWKSPHVRRKSCGDVPSDDLDLYATHAPLPIPSKVSYAAERRKRSVSHDSMVGGAILGSGKEEYSDSEESMGKLDIDTPHMDVPRRNSMSEESSAVGTINFEMEAYSESITDSRSHSSYANEDFERSYVDEDSDGKNQAMEEDFLDHHRRRVSSSSALKRCSPDRTLYKTLAVSSQLNLEIKPKVPELQPSFQKQSSQNLLPDPFFEHFIYGTPITIAKPHRRRLSASHEMKRDATRKSPSTSYDHESGSSRSPPIGFRVSSVDFPRKRPAGRQTSPKRIQRNPTFPRTPQGNPRIVFPNRGSASRRRQNGPHYTRRTIGTPSEMHSMEDTSDDYPPVPYRKSSEPYQMHSQHPAYRKPTYAPQNPFPGPAPRQPMRSPTGPRPVQNNNLAGTASTSTLRRKKSEDRLRRKLSDVLRKSIYALKRPVSFSPPQSSPRRSTSRRARAQSTGIM